MNNSKQSVAIFILIQLMLFRLHNQMTVLAIQKTNARVRYFSCLSDFFNDFLSLTFWTPVYKIYSADFVKPAKLSTY